MASNDSGRKRRRLSPAHGPGIEDVPETLLADVASYLPKPSRALFALAVSGPPSSWRKMNWNRSSPMLRWASSDRRRPPAAAMAILSPPRTKFVDWSVLDFGEVEESLAAKLTDDDIGGVLTCINAHATLKVLILDGCTGITGGCLRPLYGSATLEEIDLTMRSIGRAGHVPDSALSKDIVLPILIGIMAVGDADLNHVALPKAFIGVQDARMDEFVDANDDLFLRRCPDCPGYEDCATGQSLPRSDQDAYADVYVVSPPEQGDFE